MPLSSIQADLHHLIDSQQTEKNLGNTQSRCDAGSAELCSSRNVHEIRRGVNRLQAANKFSGCVTIFLQKRGTSEAASPTSQISKPSDSKQVYETGQQAHHRQAGC